MNIKILGYWGGYPTRGGATSGYLITTDEGRILLDCGSGVMSKLSLTSNAWELSGVVLSHLHDDHIADIGVLQYAMNGALRIGRATKKVKIYSPVEPKTTWEQIQSEQSINLPIEQGKSIEIAGVQIDFFEVEHTIPCYAVKFTYKDTVIVYSADTVYMESLADFAKEANIFICEATICEGSTHTAGAGHMDAKEAALIAKKANVGKLILTHLPSDGDFELMKCQAREVFEGEVYLAMEW